MKINGYRYSATGVFGYEFYQNKSKICTQSGTVMPSSLVRITGFGREWYSEFDMESTIVPGLARHIVYAGTNERVYKIVFRESGKFDIFIGNECIHVCIADDSYAFIYNENQIATISSVGKTENLQECMPTSIQYEIDSYFDVECAQGIREDILLAILSFPILRFAL